MDKLDRIELLAAEMFFYSYDNYADHVEVDNIRFTRLMPNDVRNLMKAEKEGWTQKQIAETLDIDISDVDDILDRFEHAKMIVDAVNPSESFRNSIRDTVKFAVKDKLTNDEIEDLVIQICYRAADLGFLLDQEGLKLSDYSTWLRREKNVDYSAVGLPNLE